MGAEEQPVTTKEPLIRNGRLYFKDLETTHRVRIRTLNALTGKPSEFTIVPVSIRPSTDGTRRDITFEYEGTADRKPFGFYKLGDQNEVYTIPARSLIENHTSGQLVYPSDCRPPLNSESIEVNSGSDIAFDVLRSGQMLALAAHNVIISVEQMAHPLRLPKTSGYLKSLRQARSAI